MSEYRSYMFDRALKREGNPEGVKLVEDIASDVCIVGGGYTGLWTAILLKEAEPELDIVLIEQKLCGYGASGCNGGCLLTLATKFNTMCKFFGREEAVRLVKASEEAVGEIEAFTKKHGIDCELRVDGAVYISTNGAQEGSMEPVLDALEEESLNSWRKLKLEEARQMAGTDDLLEGYFSAHAGSVQPGHLVRGLARVACEMGVRIYENTPMSRLEESEIPVVHTEAGSVRAEKVVLATNAWMASQFKQFERTIAVVSSDMCVTEPCPELLKEIGLDHGASVCDSRIFVHYYHTTEDGRLMIGKGGNTFAYGSKMIDSFFEPSVYEGQLRGAIDRFFPKLKDVKIEEAWNGASDRSVTGFPFFGNLNGHPGIFYGFGYSGNGVTQTILGGKTLRSMVLGLNDAWSRCGFIGGPRGKFPPEPIRWLGAMMVRNGIRRKEAAKDRGEKPGAIDRYLARFAKAAGKADK